MAHEVVNSDSNNGDFRILESPNVLVIGHTDDEDESKSLLTSKKGGLSKKLKKQQPKRKVQWLDNNGDKLEQILEFQPSEIFDDDESDACFCTMM